MSTAATPDHGHGDAGEHAVHGHGVDGGVHHDPHLAHHFDTPAQQFSTGKLGMWTFLATEVLMFGGLFCAYAVYRSNHPEVYLWAHRALDAKWGMINTIVLLASSFTMAWGVRAAQLNQKGLLQIMLALTFLGGVGFMCIKGIEYNAKWKHYLFPGELNAFNVQFGPKGENAVELKEHAITYIESHGKPAAAGGEHGDTPTSHENTEHPQKSTAEHSGVTAHAEGTNVTGATQPSAESVTSNTGERTSKNDVPNPHAEPSVAGVMPIGDTTRDGNSDNADRALIQPPVFVAAGTNLEADAKEGHHYKTYNELDPSDRQTLNAFFSIYFMMTGLHGIHVVVGMGLIAWLFIRASNGEFSEKYFTPIDLGGLYWHLVDLIWIFLFPLLYLIH